jgi:phage gp16-like protein
MTDIKRCSDLAAIHINKTKLGIDEDTYRDMLQSLTGKRSAKDMTPQERWKVLREQKRLLGEELVPLAPEAKRKHSYPGRPAVIPALEPQIGKIEALLCELKKPWTYVNTIAERQAKVSLVQWSDPEYLRGIITALVKQVKRMEIKAAQKATQKAGVQGA